MAKWTSAQSQAIESRGSNLLVAAAAGSGKTAVLVERILTLLIQDGIGIDQMLIVTFSSAAAGEMRERIQQRLTDALKTHPEKAPYLRRQLLKIGKASIMTLHAFCNEVVKTHFIEIGLDPSFKIGEVSHMSLLQQEALNHVLENAYASADEDFVYLVESYGSNRSDQKLAELILRLYHFIQAQPEPIEWLFKAAKGLDIREEDFDNCEAAKALMHYVAVEMTGILHLAQTGLSKCLEADGPQEYEANFNSDLDQLEAIKLAMDSGYSCAAQALEKLSFTRLATIKKDRKLEISERLMEDVKGIRDQVKRKLNELKSRYFAKPVSTLVEELQFLTHKMLRLSELVSDFDKQYRFLKADQNLMDFNDLEHFALEILANEGICDLYRQKYHCIFLDEYQDANIVQETLINRIKRSDNVFLVGDVKQSIYKFRLADPSLFLSKQKDYPTEAGQINRRIDLSMNFRTRGEILAVVNDLFGRIMSEDLGEIPYDKSQYLYNGMVFPEAEKASVQLSVIDLGDQDALDEEIQYMKSAEIEAHYTASQIQAALGRPVYHPKRGTYAPLSYADITVLLRSTKQWAGIFSEVFEQWGIPVFIDMGSSFFDALEVSMVLSLLRLIDNRRRDVAWLTVLRSPFVGLSVEALSEIRAQFPDKSYAQAVQLTASLDTDLGKTLKGFIAHLDRWTLTSTINRLDDWLWRVLDESGFYAYVGAMPNGQTRQANLRLLLERAGALEGQPESSLYHFIQVIEKLEKTGGDLEAAKLMPDQEDAVRIMSIHKSKGLEFPLVIIAGLGKRFNLSDTYDDIMLHKHLGIGPKYVHWEERHFRYTFVQLAMRKQMTNEMLSEEMRILYVALTRPVDQLWLIGSTSNYEASLKRWRMGVKPFNLAQAKSYLDWIAMYSLDEDLVAIDETMTSFSIERPVMGLESTSLPARLDFRRVLVADIAMAKSERALDEKAFETLLVETVDEASNLKQPQAYWEAQSLGGGLFYTATNTDHGLPGKISVSALKALSESPTMGKSVGIDMSELLALKSPKWQQEADATSPAALGTAFHTCLQHLPYDGNLQMDGRAYLGEMVAKGRLVPETANALDPKRIEAYLQSEQYLRLCQAERLEKEYPFIMKAKVGQETTLVQGIIDLYAEVAGKSILVDFKTDRFYEGMSVTQAVARHKMQLQLYAQAIELAEGKAPDEVWLYFSSIDTWTWVQL